MMDSLEKKPNLFFCVWMGQGFYINYTLLHVCRPHRNRIRKLYRQTLKFIIFMKCWASHLNRKIFILKSFSYSKIIYYSHDLTELTVEDETILPYEIEKALCILWISIQQLLWKSKGNEQIKKKKQKIRNFSQRCEWMNLNFSGSYS